MNSNTGRRLATVLVITLIVISFGSVTRAGEMLAGNDDAIKEILRETLPIATAQFAKFDSDVVQVYHQLSYDAETEYYTLIENSVWWVGRGEAEHLTNYIREYPPYQEIKDVKAFVIHGGEATVEAALAGEIQFLDETRIKIQEGGGDSRFTNLVVAFDTAQLGDLIGVSVKKEISHGLQWSDWSLAGRDPKARCELEIENNYELAFAIFGNRFRAGAMRKKVIEEKDGHVRHLKLWADDIDPIHREPYSPKSSDQSPSFSLVWRAQLIPSGGVAVWYEYRDWNMTASSFATVERYYAKKNKETKKMAKRLVADTSGEEAVELLYEFVRDELQNVSSSFYTKKNKKRNVDSVLKARAGDDYEKSYVLLQMLLSLDFEAEMIWAHDPDEGGFFVYYPNMGQVTVPLIRVKVDGRDIWLDLECPGCPPGTVQSRLAGTKALAYDREADKLDDKLWGRAVTEAGLNRIPVPIYLRMVERVHWNTLFDLEGGNQNGAALLSEAVVLTREGEQYKRRLKVRSSGRSRLYSGSYETGAEEVAHDWVESRFGDAQTDSTISESPAGADTLEVVLELEVESVPAPMGDTWILPPDLIYGEPSVRKWPEVRYSSFYVDHDNETHWEFRIPLPEGWTNASVPATQRLGVKCLEYTAHYRIEDGELVVLRILTEVGCTIAETESVAVIGRHANAIREWELTPVVLTRKD